MQLLDEKSKRNGSKTYMFYLCIRIKPFAGITVDRRGVLLREGNDHGGVIG